MIPLGIKSRVRGNRLFFDEVNVFYVSIDEYKLQRLFWSERATSKTHTRERDRRARKKKERERDSVQQRLREITKKKTYSGIYILINQPCTCTYGGDTQNNNSYRRKYLNRHLTTLFFFGFSQQAKVKGSHY